MNLPQPPHPTEHSVAFWRCVHNLVAHPLLEVLPTAWGDWLHDTTAALAFIEVEEPGSESEALAPEGSGAIHTPQPGQETDP